VPKVCDHLEFVFIYQSLSLLTLFIELLTLFIELGLFVGAFSLPSCPGLQSSFLTSVVSDCRNLRPRRLSISIKNAAEANLDDSILGLSTGSARTR